MDPVMWSKGADMLFFRQQLTAKSRDVLTEAVSGTAHAHNTRGVVTGKYETTILLYTYFFL